MSQKYILGHRAQTRSRAIRYTVLVGLLLILVAVLQVSLFSRHRLLGAVPDLMICTVLCVAFFAGRYAGAITGIGAGFFIEAMGSVGISLLPLFYFLLGYVAGHYARTVYPKRYTVYLFYFILTVIFRMIITVIYIALTYESFELLEVITKILLPEAADTAVAGCILYFPIKALCGWLMRRK